MKKIKYYLKRILGITYYESRLKKKNKISENILYIEYKKIPFRIPGRRMGNTTRLIDSFVQDFFIKGECEVYDHYSSMDSKRRVFRLVLLRLRNEHNIEDERVKLNPNRLTITNLDFK